MPYIDASFAACALLVATKAVEQVMIADFAVVSKPSDDVPVSEKVENVSSSGPLSTFLLGFHAGFYYLNFIFVSQENHPACPIYAPFHMAFANWAGNQYWNLEKLTGADPEPSLFAFMQGDGAGTG